MFINYTMKFCCVHLRIDLDISTPVPPSFIDGSHAKAEPRKKNECTISSLSLSQIKWHIRLYNNVEPDAYDTSTEQNIFIRKWWNCYVKFDAKSVFLHFSYFVCLSAAKSLVTECKSALAMEKVLSCSFVGFSIGISWWASCVHFSGDGTHRFACVPVWAVKARVENASPNGKVRQNLRGIQKNIQRVVEHTKHTDPFNNGLNGEHFLGDNDIYAYSREEEEGKMNASQR